MVGVGQKILRRIGLAIEKYVFLIAVVLGCARTKCPYKVQYCIVNKLQFDKANKCKSCEVSTEFIACSARRCTIVEGKTLKVFHCGSHSCPVMSKKEDKPVDDVRDL